MLEHLQFDQLFSFHTIVYESGEVDRQLLLYAARSRDNDVSIAATGSGQEAQAFLLHFLTESLGAIGDYDDGRKRTCQYDGEEDEDKKAVQHGRLLKAIRFDCPEITGAALNSC
ncbi:hypothetical protein [Labrenzia sp. OB1]|uniref:hypothetical protein n=1 Tax=Labrenzia sp. OB1 TaxID=1561204 RepID=UPI0007B2B529|nr:hypothetical protein [Labrenzia sp. OB1]KZM47819.1 hypothetical protein OA90_23790 [Labrenzia sp. OB1]